ncbi:TetR family transcriptional regulator [Rhizobium leguminosarum]|uniref:TetR family transcriptional regulator n=1 Tax=Rhizobium ruizarguesonis TaxID=2081791 RepID=A0AAE4YPZ4_9HYPH|nr:TetR family transcriptional regulator [Rhizobium ruizarguesonis]NEI48003.1 TetR family transcriptional regulator [Rhizobium ruizarguesonis]
MRESNRNKILDGVVRLIERDGVTGVTFDAVAAETGVTRGGVIYHFSSREDLILATHEHLAQQLETQLRDLAPDPECATDRYAAYVQSCTQDATRAELIMMLESAKDERLSQVWAGLIDHWAPPLPSGDEPFEMKRFLGRITADGLWAHQAMTGISLSPEVKSRVIHAILEMVSK